MLSHFHCLLILKADTYELLSIAGQWADTLVNPERKLKAEFGTLLASRLCLADCNEIDTCLDANTKQQKASPERGLRANAPDCSSITKHMPALRADEKGKADSGKR